MASASAFDRRSCAPLRRAVGLCPALASVEVLKRAAPWAADAAAAAASRGLQLALQAPQAGSAAAGCSAAAEGASAEPSRHDTRPSARDRLPALTRRCPGLPDARLQRLAPKSAHPQRPDLAQSPEPEHAGASTFRQVLPPAGILAARFRAIPCVLDVVGRQCSQPGARRPRPDQSGARRSSAEGRAKSRLSRTQVRRDSLVEHLPVAVRPRACHKHRSRPISARKGPAPRLRPSDRRARASRLSVSCASARAASASARRSVSARRRACSVAAPPASAAFRATKALRNCQAPSCAPPRRSDFLGVAISCRSRVAVGCRLQAFARADWWRAASRAASSVSLGEFGLAVAQDGRRVIRAASCPPHSSVASWPSAGLWQAICGLLLQPRDASRPRRG